MDSKEHDRRRIDSDVCRVFSAAEDGTLVEADRKRLNQVLAKDARARSVYLDLVALRVLLLSIAGRSVRKDAEDRAIELAYRLPGEPIGRGSGTSGAIKKHAASSRSYLSWTSVLAVAASLLLVLAGFAILRNDDSRLADSRADHSVPKPKLMAHAVATVSSVSEDAIWSDPNESLSIAATLDEGGSIRLSQGNVELAYKSGVFLKLIGPVEFRLKPEGGVLTGGGLIASVPEAGHGFTIDTPNGKVVDLGTEFGVVVDDFGYSEVGVFKGKVEAYPLSNQAGGGKNSAPFELTEGEGLLWKEDKLRRTDTDFRRFDSAALRPRQADAIGEHADPASHASTLGSTASLDWQELGEVEPTEKGFTLRGVRSEPRPFLLSGSELDPVNGTVVVECDVVFQSATSGASVAILTRSDRQRGGAAPPWRDMLATCVRCSFGANANTDGGVLEAATKHESGWEPVTLSWQGFRDPLPGERYRLAMIDDGVNVTFTVTLAKDHSVQKTVRCRSLFRGLSNHVAIEGPRDGSALVENIRIYQESASSVEPRLSHAGPALASNSRSLETPSADLIDLVPGDAKLLLSDSFDGDRLNPELWETLGEVVVQNGRLQLGERIDDKTIDTWHSRPYAVSRQSFSPADGAVTVIGRIEFAENYLTGFGGSFAVLTRSGTTYRGGDGWERTLLGSGVRLNFWPSGLELGRSLEVHEIAHPGPVPLLAKASYEIEPTERSYRFRAIDDGRTVQLTVFAASDPGRRGEVAYESRNASTPRAIEPGRVAFESTWGSPVILDEVHVFQSRRSPQ